MAVDEGDDLVDAAARESLAAIARRLSERPSALDLDHMHRPVPNDLEPDRYPHQLEWWVVCCRAAYMR